MDTNQSNSRNLLIAVGALLLLFGGIVGYAIAHNRANTVTVTPTSTPTITASVTVSATTASPTTLALQVTGVELSVNPTSLSSLTCNTTQSFTYTATFHLNAYNQGGTVTFQYTTTNGRGSTAGTLSITPGETSKTYTFTTSGTVGGDNTYPGVAEVMVTNPNVINSVQLTPTGSCHA